MTQEQADEGQALALQHTSLLTQLKAIVRIKDAEQYKQVVTWRQLFNSGIEYFAKLYDERIAEANRHHKALIKDRDGLQKAAKEGWSIGGSLLVEYDREQTAIAQRKQREEEQAKFDERRRLADLAIEMEQPALADEIERRPTEPTVVVKEMPSVKETGVHFTENWKNWEFSDFNAVPREYLLPEEIIPENFPRITKVVKALKGETKIPGVRVLPPTKTAIQRRS